MLKLFYFKSADGIPNFGDDLNPWVWRQLLGDYVGEAGETLFTGIGTLLNDRLPYAKRTIVFRSGVGFGSGTLMSTRRGRSIACRPLSARALGLRPRAGGHRPALFIATLLQPQTSATLQILVHASLPERE